jgi:hypothetical protein
MLGGAEIVHDTEAVPPPPSVKRTVTTTVCAPGAGVGNGDERYVVDLELFVRVPHGTGPPLSRT